MINSIFATVIGSESKESDPNKGEEQSVQANLTLTKTTEGNDGEIIQQEEKTKNDDFKPTTKTPETTTTDNDAWTKVVNKRKAAPIRQNTKQAKTLTNKGPNNKSPTAATIPRKESHVIDCGKVM